MKYVITELTIDGLQPQAWGAPHPESTPIGPFDTRAEANEYAHRAQSWFGNGGGSVMVAPLLEPKVLR